MVQAYSSFWNNILNFSDTSSRKQYWWPIIINWLVGGLIIGIIETSIGHPLTDIYTLTDFSLSFGSNVVAFIVWIATLSLQVRRMHDIDKSGWWILIQLVPLIGTIWFFILTILPTKQNRWS